MELNGGNVCFAASAAAAGRAAESDVTDYGAYRPTTYDWLEYLISRDAAFCFTCRSFGTLGK